MAFFLLDFAIAWANIVVLREIESDQLITKNIDQNDARIIDIVAKNS